MQYYLQLGMNISSLFKHTTLGSNHLGLWDEIFGECLTIIAVPNCYALNEVPCMDSSSMYLLELRESSLNIIASMQLDAYAYIQENYQMFSYQRLLKLKDDALKHKGVTEDIPHIIFITEPTLQDVAHIYCATGNGWSECSFTKDTLYYN